MKVEYLESGAILRSLKTYIQVLIIYYLSRIPSNAGIAHVHKANLRNSWTGKTHFTKGKNIWAIIRELLVQEDTLNIALYGFGWIGGPREWRKLNMTVRLKLDEVARSNGKLRRIS